jgi:MOSC domain-containing protein YiiM
MNNPISQSMEKSIRRFTFIRANNYAYWRTQLPGVDLPWAVFGEHFTTDGILEDQIKVGDRIRVGSAEFMVTQPRMPCYKLGIRFNRRDMVNRFLESKRTGFYVAVARGRSGGGRCD